MSNINKISSAFFYENIKKDIFNKAIYSALIDIAISNTDVLDEISVNLINDNKSFISYNKKNATINISLSHLPVNFLDLKDYNPLDFGPKKGIIDDDGVFVFVKQHLWRQYGFHLYSDIYCPQFNQKLNQSKVNLTLFNIFETIRIERRISISINQNITWNDFYSKQQQIELDPILRVPFSWLRDGAFSYSQTSLDLDLEDFYLSLISSVNSQQTLELTLKWQNLFQKLKIESETKNSTADSQEETQPQKQSTHLQQEETQPQKQSTHLQQEETQPQKQSTHLPQNNLNKDIFNINITTKEKKDFQSNLIDFQKYINQNKHQQKNQTSTHETFKVKIPSLNEINDHQMSFSQKNDNDSNFEPQHQDWNISPLNIDLLNGSTDFIKEKYFKKSSDSIDKEDVNKIIRPIEKMLIGKSRNITQNSPAKKISVRHLARGELKYLKKEDFSKGKMSIDILVDCSASMRNNVKNVITLISVFNDLNAKNLISGRVIFTSGAGWMALNFPIKEEIIKSITAFSGSEGIKNGLFDNIKHLKKSDAVFVFTDAQITDTAFSYKELLLHNIEPIGLFVGNQLSEYNMAKYFEKYIIRPSLEELATSMCQRFLMHKEKIIKKVKQNQKFK